MVPRSCSENNWLTYAGSRRLLPGLRGLVFPHRFRYGFRIAFTRLDGGRHRRAEDLQQGHRASGVRGWIAESVLNNSGPGRDIGSTAPPMRTKRSDPPGDEDSNVPSISLS